MNEREMDVLAAIQQRVSVRSYADRAMGPDLLERLLALSDTVDHLTGVPPRIALVSGVAQTRHILTYMIGSYGSYLMFSAAARGIGTCWVTGSYDAQRAGDAVRLAPGEVAAAVCALGYPAEDRWGRFHSRTVRRLASGHRRKPLTEIVFSRRWGEPWSPEDADGSTEPAEVPPLVTVLEHARLAPSATNRQPWRFIVRPDHVALALVRPAPIDAGIVMVHFALASAALGREGRWKVRLGDATLAEECGLPKGVIPVATFE